MGLFTPKPRGELQPFEVQRGAVAAQLHPRVGPELSSAWLASPGALAQGAQGGLPWRGPSPDGAWFVKRRDGRKGRRALQRSFAHGLELEEAGLAVPVHMALLTEGRTTWLVMEFLAGSDLDVALGQIAAAKLDSLLAATAATIAALHQAGFRQRDLKAPNLRVLESGMVALVDLEGIRRGATAAKREKDLGRLAASFLVLEGQGLEPAAWERLLAAYLPTSCAQLAMRTRARGEAKINAHKRLQRPSR